MPAPPSRRELIDLVWKKLAATGPYDFVEKLDLGPLGYQRYYRWTTKGAEIRYEDAWKMLEALGWIRTELTPLEQLEDFVRRLDAGERVTKQERERVARLVDRVEESVHQLAEKVRGAAQVARRA